MCPFPFLDSPPNFSVRFLIQSCHLFLPWMVPLIFQSGFQSSRMSFFLLSFSGPSNFSVGFPIQSCVLFLPWMVPLIFQSGFRSGQYTLFFFYFFFSSVVPLIFQSGFPIFQYPVGQNFRGDSAENSARQNYTGKAFKVARYSLIMWGVEIAAFSPLRSAPVCHSRYFRISAKSSGNYFHIG